MRMAKNIAAAALAGLLVSAAMSAEPDTRIVDDNGRPTEIAISGRTDKAPALQLTESSFLKSAKKGGTVIGAGQSLHFFTPRNGAAEGVRTATLRGKVASAGAVTPRGGEVVTSLKLGRVGRNGPVIGTTVATSFSEAPSALFSDPGAARALADRKAESKLAFGIGGFNLGGRVSQERSQGAGVKGLDLGVGYSGENWSTTLSAGTYKRDMTGSNANFHGVELGASYRIGKSVNIGGGIKLFDTAAPIAASNAQDGYSGVVFVGTQVNF